MIVYCFSVNATARAPQTAPRIRALAPWPFRRGIDTPIVTPTLG